MLGVNAQLWQTRLHAGISRQLSANGWSQEQISQTLGTTQSSVSRWLTRPLATLEAAGDELAIDTAAKEISDNLTKFGPPTSPLTFTVQSSGISQWSTTLSLSTSATGERGERAQIISSLHQFATSFPAIPENLKPAVGINVAVATSDATSRQDVAAFQGRLLIDKEIQTSRTPPRFGVSRHLSDLILRLRQLGGDVGAIMNLKPCPSEQLEQFVHKQNLSLVRAPRGEPHQLGDFLLDEGDFGWEPSLYITAKDVEQLFQRLENLLKTME